MSSDEIKKTYGVFSNPLNNKLISDLKAKGKDVLVYPLMKAKRLEITEKVDDFIKNLTDFDWIIFTDVYAADYFIEALRERGADFFELDNLTVCTLGEAVADRLRFVQVHADVIPPRINDTTVFSEIAQFTGGDFRGLRFLVLKEETAFFSFEENLRNEDATVEVLPVYETEFEGAAEALRLKTLLKGGAIDEFIFSGVEDVLSLKSLFPKSDLTEILNEIQASATTENAFLSLQENGLRPLYFHDK
jgi:uroporphyrinogen-III synthase